MLDKSEQKIVDDVNYFGWHCLCIEADEEGPAFSYTIGVQPTFKHPKIIIFGLAPHLAHGVLQSVVGSIKSGNSFAAPCRSNEVLENFAVAFGAVQPKWLGEYFGAGLWYRRHTKRRLPLEAVQCFWPDKSGKFPWEQGCTKAVVSVQPLLSRMPTKIL